MPRIKASTLEGHHELIWQSITSAVNELLDERDYDSITLGDIGDRAGVARNSLYRYAPDKTALMTAVAARVSGPVRAQVRDIADSAMDASDRVVLIVEAILKGFASNTVRLMMQSALLASVPSPTFHDREGAFGDIGRAMERVVEEGVRSGEFSIPASAGLVTQLLSGIMRSSADLITSGDHSPEALAQTVTALILNALGTQPAP